MASVNKKILLASTAITAASTVGSAVSVDNREVDHVAYVNWAANHADTTATVKIQHSPDNGTTWIDWIAFTAIATTAGTELKLPTSSIPAIGHIRYNVALAGSTLASTLIIHLYYRDAGN